MDGLAKINSIYKFVIRDILVFVALWLYLWFCVDIKLIYHGAGKLVGFPTFFCTWPYLQSFLVSPGGLVEYTSAFLSQLFYYSWLGSAVISLVCWINAGLTVNILHYLGLRKFDFLRFSSVLFAVITFGAYLYQFYFIVAIMVTLFAISVFFRFCIKNLVVDFLFLIVLSSLLYIAAGGCFYLFAFVIFAYLIAKGRAKNALLCSAVAALTPYLIGYLVFKENLDVAYCCLTPFCWKKIAISINKSYFIPAHILYSSLLLIACLALIKLGLTKKYPYLFIKKIASDKSLKLKQKNKVEGKILPLLNKKVIRHILVSLLWTIIFAFIAWFFYCPQKAKIFLADYYRSNRNWSKVIEIACKYKQGNYNMTCAADFALSQTGGLSKEMFSLPQHQYSLFLSAPEHIDVHWPRIDIYINLGFLNMAEHEIVESIEVFGPRPVLLKRLITVFLAKKDYQTATVYLNQLASTFFECSWAKDYLTRLKTDPDLENDSQIQYLRSVMMKKNYGYSDFALDKVLLHLLENNPKNKMAFEYLMAWYLLCGDIENVVNNFDLMDNFDYKVIPEYYQQAYLFYTGTMKKKASLKGLKIDSAVIKSYNEIVANYNLMQRGNKRAYNFLVSKYNHSYLVYYLLSPSFMGK